MCIRDSDRTIVSKLLHKTQNKQQTKTENNKFIALTYINKQTEKIAHKFKKAGYRISYKTTNKTEHTLSKHTHKAQNKFDLPGVYKLNCLNCNKFYIGQTGRSFKQRYIEHTEALHTTTESTFANHLIEANHTYKNIDNNMNILHCLLYTSRCV